MIRECPFCHIKVMLNESNYCPSCHNNVDFDTTIVDEFVSVELKPDMKLPNICIMCGDTANIRKKIKMKKSNSNSRFIRMITFAVLELALITGVIYNVRIKLVNKSLIDVPHKITQSIKLHKTPYLTLYPCT